MYLTIVFAFAFAGLTVTAEDSVNLIEDASFESPVPAWFNERGGTSYFAAKEKVDGAAGGRFVLAIQGWDRRGSRIIGPVMKLSAGTYSGTISVRSFGHSEKGFVEFALMGEKGKKALASFGTTPIDGTGKWAKIEKAPINLASPTGKGRAAIIVGGSQKGARVEVDLPGLFEGDTIGTVSDNAYFQWFEAEALADDRTWKVSDHYRYWYSGFPSGGKMLAGYHSLKAADNTPVFRQVILPAGGRYRLWVRFVVVNSPNANRFTIGLRQDDKILGVKEISDDVAVHGGRRLRWVWESMEADLNAGKAEILLTRPDKGGSWVCRKIDLFSLTNISTYQPKIQDFRPKGFLRFTNLSEGLSPFCLWIWIRRHQGPTWYANVGMLSSAGASRSYYVPRDKKKWLGPGESSPWIRITDDLLPGGGRNNVTIYATRKMHTTGFVEERIRGRFDFALGPERRPIKSIEIDQKAPRIHLTLPSDFKEKGNEIRSPYDYIKEKEAFLSNMKPPRGKIAKYLDLNASLSFKVGMDDLEVIEREISILKRLGFNSVYRTIAPPETAVEFYAKHGLQPRFSGGVRQLWSARKNRSMHHPDLDKIDRVLKRFAETNQAILSRIERVDLMDEPGGMSYQDILKSEACRKKFAEQLKREGLTPQELGVNTWEEVVPVGPENSGDHPALFYHTGIFRLEAFANFVRAITRAKNKYLPEGTCPTYVNYAPPYSGGSWTLRGTDLFFAQRNGGLELGWTEDWRGYGAGPQHLSETLAMLRSAGQHRQPLGSYCIPSPNLTMLRLQYYTLVAGGARKITSYNYGPWYASIDSWGRRLETYRSLAMVQHELGVIDEALHGTKRRKTDVAILYNRTASIWAKKNYTALQNGWYIHWALAHAGYDADFLPEEDVEAGLLRNYKVLYFHGPQIRRKAAAAISEWVESGGVLFGSAGAGMKDENDRPLQVLAEVFHCTTKHLALKRNVGRPKYELRSQPVLDVLSTVNGFDGPAVELNQLCYEELLAPMPNSNTILQNKAGEPAGTMTSYGNGVAIRVAGAPGITYLNDAVRGKEYDINSYLPKKFRRALRDFLAWPAKLAGAKPVARTGALITEIVRYDGPDRAVVFLVDHNTEPVEGFSMSLPDAAHFTRAYTASGAKVTLKPEADGWLSVTFSLRTADAVVLQK